MEIWRWNLVLELGLCLFELRVHGIEEGVRVVAGKGLLGLVSPFGHLRRDYWQLLPRRLGQNLTKHFFNVIWVKLGKSKQVGNDTRAYYLLKFIVKFINYFSTNMFTAIDIVWLPIIVRNWRTHSFFYIKWKCLVNLWIAAISSDRFKFEELNKSVDNFYKPHI